MTDEERELIDATERMPMLDADESALFTPSEVPTPAPPPRPRATLPPPIPVRARATTVPPPIPVRARATTVPPPIPVRARATTLPPPIPVRARPTSVPPPIPVRARATTTTPSVQARGTASIVAAPAPALDEPSVDIDFTPTTREAVEADRAREAATSSVAPTHVPAPRRPAASWPVVVPPDEHDDAALPVDEPEPPRRRLPLLRLALVAVCAGCVAGLAFVAMRHYQQRDERTAPPITMPVATTAAAIAPVEPPPPAAPIETPPAAPIETPPAAPIETPPAAPIETSPAAPIETPPAAPVEAAPAAPVETAPVATVEPMPAAPTTELVPAPEQAVTPAPPSRDKRTKREKRNARHKKAAPARTVAASSGHGTLMVSSKPPCEIAIDGVATVLMTPQRALKLKPGPHEVTLFNLDHGIEASFDIVIEPNRPTKLIRDFTSQMKRSAQRAR